TGAAGVDEVVDTIVAASLEDVSEADEIAVDVSERVFHRIAHSRLRREVYDPLRVVIGEHLLDSSTIGKIRPNMGVRGMIRVPRQPGFLDRRIVVIVVVVESDYLISPLEQSKGQSRADEAGRTCNKKFHSFFSLIAKNRAMVRGSGVG